MNDLFKKIKILSKNKIKSKYLEGQDFIDPHKHWKILLKVFLTISLLLIIFSIYILFEIKNDQMFTLKPGDRTSSQLIRQDLLDEVSKSFTEKEKKTNEIKAGNTVFVDPS
jgi:hypothetical protein